MLRYFLPFYLLLALLTAASLPAAAQASITPVIDWKAPATLPTYLLQQVHQQYAPRRLALDAALASAAGTQAYRDSARARFRRVLGPLPARSPLRARVTGTVPQGGFQIEKVIYESLPHHHVTANLYLPEGKGKKPAALLFCGHEQTSKATPSYQLTARLLARNGFVVLVIDPVSQGERMQLVDPSGKFLTRGGTTEHTLLNAQATLLGTNLPAEELWDNVRSLDYLLTRPEVDAARVGCLGNSGGATQTAYFMAYDDRVQVAALCSYVAAGERNLTLTGPADGCVMLPGAGAAGLDVADWPIMFASKPLLLLTGRYDFVDQTDMNAAYADTRRAYTALGQAEKTDLFTYDDGHGISAPKRAAAVAWFRRWLGASGPLIAEGNDQPLPEAMLRCTATGQVATAFKEEVSLAAMHLAEARALASHRPAYSPETLPHVLIQQLGLGQSSTGAIKISEEPRDTLRLPNGLAWQGLLLRRDDEPPLPARLLLPAPGAPTRLVLWLPGQGMAAVLRDSAARLAAYQRQGTAVLLADLRGLGETTDPAAFNDPKYYNQEYRDAMLALHLGRPLLAQRVADVGTILTLLRNDSRFWQLPILLRADGRTALVALHAALLSPRVVKKPFPMTNDAPQPPGTAPVFGPGIEQVQVSSGPPSFQYYLENPAAKDAYSEVLPGVLRRYDVPDLRRALGKRLLP
ncbi:alpha/beta hydrolase family protein [Hymenobacter ginsengisoli]|uniref:Alpha/beta hydrolase family protein n=1 Tax=Hymenobacter ginsengisoli TaxID=1051626 RepID=A0ABP8QNU7_9BACT|nr:MULTISPECIES: acetylxylan esterase [unclassified Hymenobacter]MBO2032744.1 acetylxylan esterase [Hymenobacter sp. BT559]